MLPRRWRVASHAFALLTALASGAFAQSPSRVTGTPLGTWTPIAPPSERRDHSAIYDPVRQRMIVFGGFDELRRNDVWELSLSEPARWTPIVTSGTPPRARYQHSAIYDPVGDRMIVFGGDDGQSRNDTWALSLSGTPTWSELAASSPPLMQRDAHVAIYDPGAQRMIVFGGSSNGLLLDDTWALSLSGTPEWTPVLADTQPVARYRFSAVHDPVRNRMIVFGGSGPSGERGDTWALALSGPPVWTPIEASGPSPRDGHVTIYDSARDRTILFGGSGADIWSLSLGAAPEWTEILTTNTPLRRRHTGIYDPVGDRIIAFGGLNCCVSDVDELRFGSPLKWEHLDVGVPRGRAAAVMIHDPRRARMIMFGGGNAGGHLGDTWMLPMDSQPRWEPMVTTGTPPSTRVLHTAIHDPARDRMLVFGGWDGSPLNDLWELSLSEPATWTLLPTIGAPAGRLHHSATYDPVRDRMIVIGGRLEGGEPFRIGGPTPNPDGSIDEVWALSLAGPLEWTQLHPTGAFVGRLEHGATYDPVRDRIIVHGGGGASYTRSDVWALSLSDPPVWTPIETSNTLYRSGHVSFYDPIEDQLLEWGGPWLDQKDLTALSLSNPIAWSTPAFLGRSPPYRRWLSVGGYDGVHDRWIVGTGTTDGRGVNDTWMLTRGTPLQPALECANGIESESGDSVVVTYPVSSPIFSVRSFEWTLTSERDWPSFPRRGHGLVDGAAPETLALEIGIPDTAAVGGNTFRLNVHFTGAPDNETLCDRTIEIRTTSTLVTLVTAEADVDRVRLRWRVDSNGPVTLERSGSEGTWLPIAELQVAARGEVTHEDRGVVAGGRYGYRLSWTTDQGRVVGGEIWVDVPVQPSFELYGAKPNPAVSTMTIAFSLPRAGGVRLDCFDVTGRRVAQREVHLGPGYHVMPALTSGVLKPGVYSVRLTFGERQLHARAVVTR